MVESDWILEFSSVNATLALVGGKGANLARLAQAGFPVPAGFLITTQAYQSFVATNRLEPDIEAALLTADVGVPESLEQSSSKIRAIFSAGKIPQVLVESIHNAYQALGEGSVAVRSSATAEDLPDMSFAGQQDTYLNVLGSDSLIQSVVNCWSSLWTARAIGYRMHQGVAHAGTALAVVVQKMVESQASGVMFTANPLTGLRSETVIDATMGLGEALVSGQVEPDHYVVNPDTGKILSCTLGAKALSIHGRAGGGTLVTQQERKELQALPNGTILELAQFGSQVAALYGIPQDIEWAWAGNTLHILQSRPVTSLFPTPTGLEADPLEVLFSFAAVQGMLDPVTPLGRDSLRFLFAMGAGLFGKKVTPDTQTVLYEAAERLWVNITPILSNSIGQRVVPVVLAQVEPTVRQAVEQIKDDSRLQPKRPGIRLRTALTLARFFTPLALNVFLNLMSPRQRRAYIVNQGEEVLNCMEKRIGEIQGDRWQKLAQQACLLAGEGEKHLPRVFLLFVSGVASGMAAWNFLNMLAEGAVKNRPAEIQGKIRDLVLQVTRGMPNNPTTEMDLALWEMAKKIRNDPESWKEFTQHSPAKLAERFREGELQENIRQVLQPFITRYGGRGFCEIDLGRSRWAEDPTHILEMLSSFLQIDDETQAPDIIFARSADAAEKAIQELDDVIRMAPMGWLKARLMRFFAGRARQLMGMRESPKFFAVRMMWLEHRELLKTGKEFVQAGELKRADDLFFLTYAELEAYATQQPGDWCGLIAIRRANYEREMRRKQIPRLLLSDGRAFFDGMTGHEAGENAMMGSPVSPGCVEGQVRVVFDPRQAGLQPGEILVCRGTDPSWTPLFLSAAALIMETGGMMTHGAVVAREYGIPAIVGVHQATVRLVTGQMIRVNGSSGRIELLSG